jgi:Helix-turn-helix domain
MIMSIQAITWVIRQDIPSRAKIVLFALANRADEDSGYCWPSIEQIMRDASCSRRAVFNFLGALERNGYIEIRKKRGKDGRSRSSDYFIIFDRQPSEWKHSGRTEEEEYSTDDDAPEVEHLCAPGENEAQEPILAPPQTNPCTPVYEPSDSNRQSPSLKEGPPVISPPKEFSASARKQQQAKLQAAEETRSPKSYFVIKGSEPWKWWLKHGHSPTLYTWNSSHQKHGWHFRTLYPPKATGPPTSPTMTEADEEELAKWG